MIWNEFMEPGMVKSEPGTVKIELGRVKIELGKVKIELAHHFELTHKKVDMQREREIEACLENMREVGAKKRARHRAQVHFQVVLSVFLLRSRTCC